MHPNRLIRFLLLLLFALLQCVAPFAHAHVSGNNADQNVHFNIIESPWLHDHDTEAAHFSAEEHPSPVVCMPPEFRSGDLTSAQHISANNLQRFALREHITRPFITHPQEARPAPPYQHPCSQAPPA